MGRPSAIVVSVCLVLSALALAAGLVEGTSGGGMALRIFVILTCVAAVFFTVWRLLTERREALSPAAEEDSEAGLYRALLALEVDQTCGLMILSEELQVLVVNEAFREACPEFGAIEAWTALERPDESGGPIHGLLELVEGAMVGSKDACFSWAGRFYMVSRMFLCGRIVVKVLELMEKKTHEEVSLEVPAGKTERVEPDFLRGVGHDLKTPLVSIRGYTELLLTGGMGKINETQRHGLEAVLRNLDRLLMMIEGLLEFNQSPNKSLSVRKREEFDLTELVFDVVELSQVGCIEAGIDLKVRRGESGVLSASVKVMADRVMLNRILTNLVSNAIKFTLPGGKVRVYLRLADPTWSEEIDGRLSAAVVGTGSELDNAGKWVMLRVLDTGIGIDEEDLEKIFEPGVTSSDREGLGLGLALTEKYVRLHEGFIEVSSEKGIGTVMTLWLPIGLPTDEGPGPETKAIEAPVNPDLESLNTFTVLVVDDEPDIVDFLSMVLTQAGCCVSQAGSIEEMFASVESSQPDAILMDYHIHGETSLAALSVLKGRAETRDIPIGIISGRHDSALVEMAMKAGALLCIPKPIGIDELVCIVSQMREGGRHGALAVPLGQSCGQNGTAS